MQIGAVTEFVCCSCAEVQLYRAGLPGAQRITRRWWICPVKLHFWWHETIKLGQNSVKKVMGVHNEI
eukprot:COSAG01_NODE_1392_length_10483_cov_26.368163_8_plen_67_part_00